MFKEKTEIRIIHTDDDLKEASRILTESFINLNSIWKNMSPDYNDVYEIFYYKMFESLRQNMAYGFYVDGKLVGATGNYVLDNYLIMPSKPTKSKLFDLLGYYGSLVERVIPKQHDRRGEAVYGAFAAVAPEHSFKGYSLWFWLEGFKLMQQAGYKTYYSRMSSPVSLFLLKKIGAVEIGEVEMTEE
jgi:hypothetical protein